LFLYVIFTSSVFYNLHCYVYRDIILQTWNVAATSFDVLTPAYMM